MRRIMKLLAAAVGVMCLLATAADAASSPTVASRSAIGIHTNSATLRAVINPNGHQTSYVFQYGPTTAYGFQTASHSAGPGTKPIVVKVQVTALNPGTVYHFRVAALSSAGGALGADRAFRTAGKPPASVVTGPPVNVSQNQATLTGTINPNGAATNWFVQYGLCPDAPAPCNTTLYSAQTLGQTGLAAGHVPEPVSVVLAGLAPGKLYHYRIVAKHPNSIALGSDVLVFTQPRFRRKPTMTTRTSPRNLRRKPYTFTTAGTLHGANFIPNWLRCTGRVGIRYYAGRRQVAFVLVAVGSDCRFSTPVSFRHLVHGRRTALSAKIFYRGNGYLRSTEKTDHVTLG